jgi:nicotinamide-nucleotide amidase
VAFLASSGEIKVRITARAADSEAAEALIAPVEAEVKRRLGPLVFGIDDDTVERVLLRELGERDWTLGTAESATGGLIAGRITGVPGASEVFRGALVAYATDLKEHLIGVPGEILAEGVVSEETAMAMAEEAADRLGADVVIALTGSAGPEPQERAAGTMVFAIRTPEDTRARTLKLPGDRERVRTYSVTAALHLARRAVAGEWWPT